jgi:signal transduction histidine kinase
MRRDNEIAVEAARVAERRQIARELHDVVTHHVTMLVVQAEAAASKSHLDDADRIIAFDSVATIGRDALAELRQLLGVLRDPDERAPAGPVAGIDHIAELIARTRATGLEVDYRAADTNVSIPTAVDVAAYRVVQEALTNVIKHSDAHGVVVSVAIDDKDVEVEITDDGPGRSGADGVGLTGLRERIGLLGGTIEAAPQPLGGYRLHARIPIGAAQ